MQMETNILVNGKKVKKNGKGVMIYKNGNLYDGEWKNDLRHGNGILTEKNGDVQHKGSWVDDKPIN
jgi:hypothetical protein